MPDVSIIIVNYNAANLLKDCLVSIKSHSQEVSYEIIVVDNHSTDIDLNELINSYKDIKLIQNSTNRGYSAANNQGLEIATGKFTLFLNNDILFTENTLKKILEFVRKKENIFLGCKLLNSDGSHQISVVDFDNLSNLFGENFFLYKIFPYSKRWNKFHLSHSNKDIITEVDAVKGAFLWGRTEDFRRLNGFDERFYFYNEENDLCFRHKKNGGKVIYYPETSIIHYGGATTEKMLWFRFRNLSIAKIQFFQKHFKGLKLMIMILVHYFGIIIRVPLYAISGILLFNKFNLQRAIFYFRTLFVYPRNIMH